MSSSEEKQTENYIAKKFGEYYNSDPELFVKDIAQREWMIVDAASGHTKRHIAMPTLGNLRHSIKQETPLHLYHSVGYYPEPDCTDMAQKKNDLIKADLLLDIDCKPGPPPAGDGYRTLDDALAAAKTFTKRVHRIITDDLGVKPDEYYLVFSGSKGYHIRGDSDKLQHLSQNARREIAALITGNGGRIDHLFPGYKEGQIVVPRHPPTGGLPRRVYLGLKRFYHMTDPDTRPDGIEELIQKYNKSTALPEHILDTIHNYPDIQTALQNEPHLGQICYDIARHLTCPTLDTNVVGNLVGLARMPGSLNGKTGLMCKQISFDEIDQFDPFIDANPWSRDTQIQIKGLANRSINTKDGKFSVVKDETVTMPEYIAMIFLASHSAVLA